jgi:hypothetical protein
MLAEMVAWQPPRAGSRPVPIGSQSIGVSLQPAIPRRVAPQQSPSASPVTDNTSSIPIRRGNQMRCSTSLQGCSSGPCPAFGWGARARVRRQRECHLYFARRVSFYLAYLAPTASACASLSVTQDVENDYGLDGKRDYKA